MFNKKRIFVFIVFLLLLFFLMTFGGGRGQNAAIATRTVTFTDGYNMKDIAKYEVEVGKDAVVPEVPVHSGYVFTGWYDFENQSVKVTNFTKILEDLHVLAKYSRDANGNGIPDENDDYFTVTFMDSIDKVAIKSQRVLTGMGATAPNAPVHEGFVFTGWDKPYNKVVSDLIINALYDSSVSEYSSYKVEYYTIHNDETSLYDTKSLNAKTADTVSAEIITIEGYTYDSSNPLNVISGFVSPDNSLVLKVYYNANEYTVIVDPSCEGDKCNQIEEPHEYGDEFELPKLSNSYTLTYDEADEIGEGLDPEVVPATLIGYCKSMETCENPIPAGTKVTVKEDVTYYAVWSEEDVTLKTGSGYETQEKIYSFAKWENGGKQYEAGATFTLTKNETVTAKYTSVPKQYTVIIEPNCAEGEDCTPTDDPENPVPTDPVDYGTTIKLPNIERAYRLTFIENENVKNQLGYEDYVSTLQGYCKNVATCEKTDDTFYNVGDEVTVEEDVTYYAIYDKPVLTAEFGNGANYSTTTENGYFTKWTEEEAETSAEVTSPLTMIADKTIYAQYDKKAKYTITWKNDDGSVLETDTEVEVGTTPTYDGETPTKAADAQYTYTFNTWSPEVTEVTGDAEYTATYTNTTNTYTVTWKNEDGSVLETDTGVAYGTTPTYDGETPTKAADAQYTYTFNTWTPEVTSVTGDAEYTATYTNTTNTYTVTWKNEDGSVLETDTGVAYGTTPSYDGETPTKAADAQYTYTFNTWSPEVTSVTGDAEYTATYTNTTNTYTVTWKNEDGSVLETDTGVAYGTTPTYDGETPTKAADAQYTYTFNTWTPEVTSVTGDAEYTATYTNTTNTYTVTWKNWDGSVLETDTDVAYGTTPTYDGETPTRPASGTSTYKFKEWSPAVTSVTGNAEYTATYDEITLSYTFNMKVYRDGEEITDYEDLVYGDRVVYELVVTNNGTAEQTITITDPGLASSLSNITYDSTNGAIIDAVAGSGYDITVPGKTGDTAGTQTLTFEFTVTGGPGKTLTTNPNSDGTPVDEERITNIETIVSIKEITNVGSNVVLALDYSYSMRGTKLTNMRNAAKTFIDTVADGNTKVCVILFPNPATGANEAVDKGCSTVADTLKGIIDSNSSAASSFGTPYSSAFMMIGNKLNNAFTGNETKKPYHVVFLSDGDPYPDNDNGYDILSTDFKSKNVTIHTIGFSVNNTARAKLQSLASSGNYHDASESDIAAVFANIANSIGTSKEHTKLGLADISNRIIPSKPITFDIIDKDGNESSRSFESPNLNQARLDGYIVDGDGEVQNKVNAAKEPTFMPGDKIEVTYYAEPDGTNHGKTGTVLETYIADSITLNCQSVMTRGSQTATLTVSPEGMYYGTITDVSYAHNPRLLDFNRETLVISTRNRNNGRLYTGTETITITTSAGLTASCTIEIVTEEEFNNRSMNVQSSAPEMQGLRSMMIIDESMIESVEDVELDDNSDETIVEPETNEETITDEVINNETIIPETNEVETPVEEPTEVVETTEAPEEEPENIETVEEVPETITELPVEVEPIGEVVSVEPIVEETNSTEVVEPEESEEE